MGAISVVRIAKFPVVIRDQGVSVKIYRIKEVFPHGLPAQGSVGGCERRRPSDDPFTMSPSSPFEVLRVLVALLCTAAVACGAMSERPSAAQAARELNDSPELAFIVNGQVRQLVLARQEVAVPRLNQEELQLPDGADFGEIEAEHRLIRWPQGLSVGDWLERVNAPQAVLDGPGGRLVREPVRTLAPVFYEKGREGVPSARRVASTQLLLVGVTRAEADAAASASAAKSVVPSVRDDLWILTYDSAYRMVQAALGFQRQGLRAEPQLTRRLVKRVAPNDPLYNQQFYFKNTGQNGGTSGEDINIESLWPVSSGLGVTVSVVDDGLEIAHPDLAPNVAQEASLHRDVVDDDGDPTPPDAKNHGTVCAGFIAARGNNAIGLTGAAPQARLLGVRLLGEGRNTAATDIKEAEALGWRTDVVHISNNSWGPDDDAATVSGPDTAAVAALRAGVESGRSNRGVLYFVATGNGRDDGDHAGYDGFSGSRYVFAVAATNNEGRQASFSESGPQAIVCAAGQTREGSDTQLLATDNVGARGVNTGASPEGDYTTSGTQGTSYATPQAAGVAALVLQANPSLGWRDVKEIFIRTARKNDPTDTEWVVNGAGFHFNHKYGAGFIDASAAVALARTWTNLGPERSASLVSETAGSVPDNTPAGLSRTFAFSSASTFRAETVEVKVNVSHAKRGQLRFELVSPVGTTTVLGAPRAKDTAADFSSWTFSTPRHWGEGVAGTWTVRIIDTVEGVAGTLNSAQVVVYGSLTATGSAPEITAAPAPVSTTVGGSATFSVTATSSSPVTYQWRKDGVAIGGATGATLTLNAVAAADAGTYSVVVSNSVGSTTSSGAALSVAVGVTSRLSNLSVRTPLGTGRTFIVGFVMTGGAKPVLLRAVGPRLGVFGVTDAHPNPRFELFNSANASVAQNDDWGGGAALAATFASVGAFSLEADSRDAALSSSLSGGHTVHISGAGSGVVLVEAYDAGSGNSPRLLNVSARNRVGAGGDILIAGFVIGGTGSKTVLIRAVGPTLSAFGVEAPLKDPKLEVYQGSNLIAENDDWALGLATAFAKVGAFALPSQSRDAAITLTLQPNAYTVHVKGLDGGSGEAIIEIYDLDG